MSTASTQPPIPGPEPRDDALLAVRHLHIAYPGGGMFGRRRIPVVHGVTFDVGRGETFGLVGESGSGKSTTGRAILRLIPVQSGSIVFDGQEITEFGRRTPLGYRREVQAVFQDPSMSLNPRQPVSYALSAALQRHGMHDRRERAAKVAEAFEQVGLQRAHLERYPTDLSGGQQQRVAIARALIFGPSLVVCDEAVSALDLSTQNQILALLNDLQEQTGVSYLFIAHDLAMVRQFCDRIAVMRQGEIVEQAPAAELFAHPQHRYTRQLLGAAPAEHPSQREQRREIRAKYAPLRAAQQDA